MPKVGMQPIRRQQLIEATLTAVDQVGMADASIALIARLAAPHAKGAALGVYNTLQSLGLFAGGALGGALAAFAGPQAVWLACALLGLVWLGIAGGLVVPARRGEPSA